MKNGHEPFGYSVIVNPQGEIVARAISWNDEPTAADPDKDTCALGRSATFDSTTHRRLETYNRIGALGGTRKGRCGRVTTRRRGRS